MKTEKIDDVKRPIRVGEEFLVPCLVKREGDKVIFTPVINNPHNDVENDQPEIHYHTDYRFVIIEKADNGPGFNVTDGRFGYIWAPDGRVEEGKHGQMEYHILPVINENHNGITQEVFIRNSKFKHKCIIKGKCPHRGYDLSQEKPVDGIITCPLHGLTFYANTQQITKEKLQSLSQANNYEIRKKKRFHRGLRKFDRITNGQSISFDEWKELNEDIGLLSRICYHPASNEMKVEWEIIRTPQ